MLKKLTDASGVALLISALPQLLSPFVKQSIGAISVARLGHSEHDTETLLRLTGDVREPRATIRLLDGGVAVASTPGGEGPTPRCFDRRWIQSLSVGARKYLEDPKCGAHSLSSPLLPAHHGVIAQVVEAIADDQKRDDGRGRSPALAPVWHWDFNTGELRRHLLMRSAPEDLPPDDPTRARIVLTPDPVADPGALRAKSPEELGLPVDALLNPICGVVGKPGLRGYDAPASAPVGGAFEVRSKWHFHTMWWGGHGSTFHQSELLGVLEGLERLAGFKNHREPVLWGTARDVQQRPHVDLSECGLYAPVFYQKWPDRSRPWTDLPVVPWVNGWSLRDDRLILVPEQIAYYGDHRPDVTVSVQECSNGCASGSSVTEAVLHGLLELIERDSFLIQWHAGQNPPEIDLDTVDDPVTAHMRAQVELLGYHLRCFDLRVDLPVPAIACVAVRKDGGPGTLCFAGGAGLDPHRAVRAAVCETASFVPSLVQRLESNADLVERALTDFTVVEELEHHALLYGHPEMARYASHWLDQNDRHAMGDLFGDWDAVRPRTKELRTPTQLIIDLLADKDMDTVVVDQTTPEQRALGLNTVSVIVPGLIPIDFGWERQRVLEMSRTRWALFDAGKHSHPLVRSDLLQAPHPFP